MVFQFGFGDDEDGENAAPKEVVSSEAAAVQHSRPVKEHDIKELVGKNFTVSLSLLIRKMLGTSRFRVTLAVCLPSITTIFNIANHGKRDGSTALRISQCINVTYSLVACQNESATAP